MSAPPGWFLVKTIMVGIDCDRTDVHLVKEYKLCAGSLACANEDRRFVSMSFTVRWITSRRILLPCIHHNQCFLIKKLSKAFTVHGFCTLCPTATKAYQVDDSFLGVYNTRSSLPTATKFGCDSFRCLQYQINCHPWTSTCDLSTHRLHVLEHDLCKKLPWPKKGSKSSKTLDLTGKSLTAVADKCEPTSKLECQEVDF